MVPWRRLIHAKHFWEKDGDKHWITPKMERIIGAKTVLKRVVLTLVDTME